MSKNSLLAGLEPRAREELLANPTLLAKVLAIYKQHPDGRGGRGVIRLLPKKSNTKRACPH